MSVPTWFTTGDRQLLRLIAAQSAAIIKEMKIVAINETEILAAITDLETKEEAVAAAIDEVVKELVALRNAGGGAIQNDIDAMTGRLKAISAALQPKIDEAVAVEQPDTGTGAAGQASASLKAQDTAEPK